MSSSKKASVPALTRSDPLNPLFASNLFLLAFVIWLTGWGTLSLLAWGTDNLWQFFRNPKFMISDFLLLPTCGFLVARFYRSIEEPAPVAASVAVTRISLVLATIAGVLAAVYSIFISKNYSGAWSVPHSLFIWFMAYVLIGFFIRVVLQLRFRYALSPLMYLVGVALLMVGHAVFGAFWG